MSRWTVPPFLDTPTKSPQLEVTGEQENNRKLFQDSTNQGISIMSCKQFVDQGDGTQGNLFIFWYQKVETKQFRAIKHHYSPTPYSLTKRPNIKKALQTKEKK